MPLGVALYNGDQYGRGPTWNKYVGNAALNPYQILLNAKKGLPPLTNVSNSSGNTTLSNLTQNLTSGKTPFQLTPTADVTIWLWALDQGLLFTNPFDVKNVTTDTAFGVTFDDPFSWIEGFGTNLVNDLSAWVVRTTFIIFGLIVLYKALNLYVDVGAVVDATVNAVKTGAVVAGA